MLWRWTMIGTLALVPPTPSLTTEKMSVLFASKRTSPDITPRAASASLIVTCRAIRFEPSRAMLVTSWIWKSA